MRRITITRKKRKEVREFDFEFDLGTNLKVKTEFVAFELFLTIDVKNESMKYKLPTNTFVKIDQGSC